MNPALFFREGQTVGHEPSRHVEGSVFGSTLDSEGSAVKHISRVVLLAPWNIILPGLLPDSKKDLIVLMDHVTEPTSGWFRGSTRGGPKTTHEA